MRIHVFTPLPPLRTDIANHSEAVLAALASRCDVVAWTTQADPTCAGLRADQIRRYDPLRLPLHEVNAADAVFYNFGNHAGFHRPIFQASMAVPGIAILHDLNMQHFFARFAMSRSTEDAYLAVMRRHHGAEAEAEGRRFIKNEIGIEALVERYPLPLAAADRAIAMVGHNRSGMEMLSQQSLLPTFFLPLSTRYLDASGTTPRVTSGVTAPVHGPDNRAHPGPYRIIAFGFMGPNRRLPSLLRAIAALPDPLMFRLDVYGPVEDAVELDRLVDELRLGSQVIVHGFVPAEVLTAAIDAADLAVNLRFPTMGEASGSQLRIWAHALPSLVTRVGWYADLPEDTVGFVDSDDEVASLVRHLLAFHRDPAPYRAAGRRGHAVARAQHTPGAYADGLLAIARAAPVQHRRRGAIDLTASISGALASMMTAGEARLVAPAFARGLADILGPPRRQPAPDGVQSPA